MIVIKKGNEKRTLIKMELDRKVISRNVPRSFDERKNVSKKGIRNLEEKERKESYLLLTLSLL